MRDGYQDCFHVETSSLDRNDTMNEQTRRVRLQHRLMQIQEEGSRKPSKDDSNQRRFMKDDGDGSTPIEWCAIWPYGHCW